MANYTTREFLKARQVTLDKILPQNNKPNGYGLNKEDAIYGIIQNNYPDSHMLKFIEDNYNNPPGSYVKGFPGRMKGENMYLIDASSEVFSRCLGIDEYIFHMLVTSTRQKNGTILDDLDESVLELQKKILTEAPSQIEISSQVESIELKSSKFMDKYQEARRVHDASLILLSLRDPDAIHQADNVRSLSPEKESHNLG